MQVDAYAVMCQPFDYEAHKREFINYCEVVIDRDGKVSYSVPSHVEHLKRMYRDEFHSEPDDDCPRERYCDYDSWLCEELSAVMVWFDKFSKVYNDAQRRELKRLHMHGCCKFPQRYLKLLS